MQTEQILSAAHQTHRQAVQSLFRLVDAHCEGSIAVDREARIVWINDKYRTLLGLPDTLEVIGHSVEEIIPSSLMRRVVNSGQPILFDIVEFQNREFVVSRIPLLDAQGEVAGAMGFVLYDNVEPLNHLLGKFSQLQRQLVTTERELGNAREQLHALREAARPDPSQFIRAPLDRSASPHPAPLEERVRPLGELVAELERKAIHSALEATRGKKTAAAKLLGISRAKLYERLAEFGMLSGKQTGNI